MKTDRVGSAGVQAGIELLQTEIVKDMALCGKNYLKKLPGGSRKDPSTLTSASERSYT